jgi:hypothetical protein
VGEEGEEGMRRELSDGERSFFEMAAKMSIITLPTGWTAFIPRDEEAKFMKENPGSVLVPFEKLPLLMTRGKGKG